MRYRLWGALLLALQIVGIGTAAADSVTFEEVPGSAAGREGPLYRIQVEDGSGRSYGKTTGLAPGCDGIPAISEVTFDGVPGHLLCGSYGGRGAAVMVIAKLSGEWADAMLFASQNHPVMYHLQTGNYFFTEQTDKSYWEQGSIYQVYRLTATANTFGFVASDDDGARGIYAKTLQGWLAEPEHPFSEARYIGPQLRLIGQVHLARQQGCDALATIARHIDESARSELKGMLDAAARQYGCAKATDNR
jgi:hypothetical protein